MKTIAIANQKGGTGKTTTAYNLGIALTQQGYRVLMVDFDPQGNLSCYCGIPPEQDLEQTITELLMKVAYEKPLSNRECVYQSKRTDDSAPQVDFIPSNLRLASFELAMGTMMCREVLLKTCLEQYSSQYDYCIIDCSPSVGLLLTNALSAANEVIIPMQAQPFSVVGMSQLTNSISSVQRKINPGLHIRGVLLTMTQHTKVSEHYAHDVRAKYGRWCADYCGCHLLRHADSRVKEGCAIFEDTIRSQLEGISATVNSMGQNSGLLSSLTDWNSTLAGYADSISTGVVMPVALTLLALFMILELYNATQRIAMNGSSNAFTIQQIALVMMKIVVCRWAVLHTTEILNALFEIASTVTVGISGYVGSGEVNTTVDIENAIAALPGGIGNMPVALELMVVGWMLRLVNIVVNTIVAARFIELYVYNALASLSMATLCYQELHGVAVNFLKSYLAVALQGAVLYLVIGFYPALAASLGSGGSITEQAWAMLGQSVILLVAVFMSGNFTKAITNAVG